METRPHSAQSPHFRALRVAIETEEAPSALEAKLLDHFRAQAPRKPARWVTWWAPAATLAVSMVMGVWLLLLPPRHEDSSTSLAEWAAPVNFVALEPLPRIALEPKPTLVETQFSGLALAQMGMPVPPEWAHRPLRAEMLVGAAGHPLAIRISTQRRPR